MKCGACGFEEKAPWRCSQCGHVNMLGFVVCMTLSVAIVLAGFFVSNSGFLRWYLIWQGLMLIPYKTLFKSVSARDTTEMVAIGIGSPIAEAPSRTTVYTDHVYGGSAVRKQ
jgi:hypothetical protein